MAPQKILLAICCAAFSGCDTEKSTTARPDSAKNMHAVNFSDQDWSEHPFRVHWPPRSPDSPKHRLAPLLNGKLLTAIEGRELRIAVLLERPSSESDRQKWNELMEFPQYEWMSSVHVWDKDREWLWPNLPYLLRAYGEERIERYGGTDPKKLVDNDFAPVVVRCGPDVLLSAEWYGSSGDADRQSIVHTARSDIFNVELKVADLEVESKKLFVDLVFADFMAWKPPADWPTEPEMAGGILASAAIVVELTDGLVTLESVVFQVPDSSTGVDWEEWMNAGQPKVLTAREP